MLTHFSALRFLRSYSLRLGMLATISSQAQPPIAKAMQLEPIARKWWTRSLVWLLVAGGLLLAISGSFQLAVWLLPGYRHRIEQEVSRAIGQPVAMDKLALTWRWARPMLEVSSLKLLASDGHTPLLTAQKLRLGFEPSELLHGRWVPSEVNVEGLALAIEIDAEGHARLRGLQQQGTPPTVQQVVEQLQRFDRIKAARVSFSVRDARVPGGNFAVVLAQGDLRIARGGMELRARLNAPGVLADTLTLKAGFAGDARSPRQLSGQWTLEAEQLQPGAALIARLPVLKEVLIEDASLKANGEWQHAELGEISASFQARRLGLRSAGRPGPLRNVAFSLRYLPAPSGGSLQLKNLQLIGAQGPWPAASARLAWQQTAAGRSWSGNADYLRLDDLSPWLSLLAAAPGLPRWQALAATASGEVQGLEGRYAPGSSGPSYALRARLLKAGIGARSTAEGGNGLHGLSGDVSATEAGGEFTAHGESASLVLGKALTQPVAFAELSARLGWQREAEGWQLAAPDLRWKGEGTEGHGSFKLALRPEASPRLDLKMDFSAPEAARLKPLMPRIWGVHLKEWLASSIVSARIPSGRLWINGPLADFPFHKQPSGEWGLDLDVRNAQLRYLPEWPLVEKIAASLHFRGNGLRAELSEATSMGLAASKTTGLIEDFAHSPLVLDIGTKGEAALYYAFLRASPLRERLHGLLDHTEGEGPAAADVHLEVPLHSNLGQKLVATGTVRLADNRLRVKALDAPVEGITGSLRFGGPVGLAAEGLTARFHGTPATADILAGGDGVDVLNARFSTRMDEDAGLAARYLPGWLRSNLSGTAGWRLALPLSGPQGGRVTLSSPLVGVASALPAPLAKTAAEPLLLGMVIYGDETAPLRLVLDARNRLGLALRWARTGEELGLRGVSIVLGGGNPGLAGEDGIRVTGAVDRGNPADWLGLLGSLKGGSLAFLGAQFTAQHLAVGGYETDALAINATQSREGALSLGFNGPGGAGNASLSADHSRLSVELQRLSLRDAPDSPSRSASTAKAASEPLNPAELPALDVRVEALAIGGVPFGAFNLATEPEAGGQKLSAATLTGGAAQLSATGHWRRKAAAAEAAVDFTLASADLASVLEGLGFAPTLTGKEVLIKGKLDWQSAGGGLDWAMANGRIDLAAENGTLKTLEPGGAGRVLGLLNLYALPRRLALDFRDVTSQGLGYDRIEGSYELANGTATAREVSIKGPSVRMQITGTVGLKARTLDQTVTVTPNTSGLTLGAVLVGGATLAVAPPVGLLAVIANQVLDKPIGKATEFSYRVTGPWDNPDIRRSDGTLMKTPVLEAPVPEAVPPAPEAPGTAAPAAETPPAPAVTEVPPPP